MSGFGNGFGSTAAATAQNAPAAPTELVFEIPADPNWEPMEFADTLETDGYFAGVISKEKMHEGEKGGVWFSITLSDADVAGKRVDKLMPDVGRNPKGIFVWRQFMRCWGGSTEAAKQGLSYRLGMVMNVPVFVKVTSRWDTDKEGNEIRRSSVDAYITQAEYNEAVAKKAHRWAPPAQPAPRAGGMNGVTGLPSGFPTAGGFNVPQPQTLQQSAPVTQNAGLPVTGANPGTPIAVPLSPPAPAAGASPFPFPTKR